jgi:hypothetical protein
VVLGIVAISLEIVVLSTFIVVDHRIPCFPYSLRIGVAILVSAFVAGMPRVGCTNYCWCFRKGLWLFTVSFVFG